MCLLDAVDIRLFYDRQHDRNGMTRWARMKMIEWQYYVARIGYTTPGSFVRYSPMKDT